MATMTECPNHAGAFDCSPFCALCEGAQEVPTMITENTTAERKRETMQEITINGRELAIGFDYASQGFRMTAWEYDGREWNAVPHYDNVLCILMTQFDALCGLASTLWEDASQGETLAQLLGVDLLTYDDVECFKCGDWYHYGEMTELPAWNFVCADCKEGL